MSRVPDGFCPICGEFMEVLVSNCSPWLDDKSYEHICFTCYSLPKSGELAGDEWKEFDDDSIHLRSVEEMMDDGWNDKNRIRDSIRGVKAALRKAKKKVARSPNKTVQNDKKPPAKKK